MASHAVGPAPKKPLHPSTVRLLRQLGLNAPTTNGPQSPALAPSGSDSAPHKVHPNPQSHSVEIPHPLHSMLAPGLEIQRERDPHGHQQQQPSLFSQQQHRSSNSSNEAHFAEFEYPNSQGTVAPHVHRDRGHTAAAAGSSCTTRDTSWISLPSPLRAPEPSAPLPPASAGSDDTDASAAEPVCDEPDSPPVCHITADLIRRLSATQELSDMIELDFRLPPGDPRKIKVGE